MNTILTFLNIVGIMDNQYVSLETEKKSFRFHIDRKKLLAGIGIFAAVLAIAGTAFLSYRNQTTSQSVATRASEQKDTVNLILELEKDKTTGEVRVLNAIANDGYPTKQSISPEKQNDTSDFIVNQNDNIVASIVFDDHFIYESQSHLEEDHNGNDPRIMYDNPKTYISLPYNKSDTLFITSKADYQQRGRNLKKQELDKTKISLAANQTASVNKNPTVTYLQNGTQTTSLRAPASGNSLDVLFMSSGYSDMSRFRTDADAMANLLMSVPPYPEFSDSIRIIKLENTQDVGCVQYERYLACDPNRILAAAAQVQYDYIVVVHNTNLYGGGSYGHVPISFTYRNIDERAREVMVHEFSHSFGHLADEYTYGTTSPAGEAPLANCDNTASCSKWAGTPDTGCFQICPFTNFYRSTYSSSLMRTTRLNELPYGFIYHTVGENAIRARLLEHGLEVNPPPNLVTSFGSSVYTDNLQRQFAVKGNKIYRRIESNWNTWEDITYFVNPPNQVGTGEITGFSVEVYQDNLQRQFLVRGGEIHRRTQRTNGSFGNWENITSFVNPPTAVGSGTITHFSVGVYQDNYQRQFLTRGGQVYRRTQNASGWTNWENITSLFNTVGSGTVTAFSSTVYQDNKQRQFVVKGNRVYRRTEPNWNQWDDITSLFDPLGQ